ncbi:hypothetical protein LCGC14_2821260 [marine sediment metagenome]|uniref:Uncharacterized protein n=1 Tax=marine sediment metagenome TaxID=412755 RepID=A0A0F9B842_9ZZZZ
MGDLILIFSVGVIIWWIFFSRKKRGTGVDSPDRDGLTETQRRWHENKARERLEHISNDITESLDRLDTPTRQTVQKLMEIQEYVATHKRPFTISEWLVWDIEPQFVKKYCTWAAVYFSISFLPLLWGWPVNLVIMMGFWLYLDSVLYKQKLISEITEWNPEWQEKFGEKDK